MPFERGGRSQYRIETGIASILGDLVAEAKIVADQIALGDVEDLAHPRIRQIEHPQPSDTRLADTPNNFQR